MKTKVEDYKASPLNQSPMMQLDDASDIHMMNRLENYIEENYDSPDWSQIVQMRRIKEIQDIDFKFDNMEKIEEQSELDHLEQLLNKDNDDEDLSPMENRRVKSFTVSRINVDDKSPVISDKSPLISEQKSLLVSDEHITKSPFTPNSPSSSRGRDNELTSM